MKLSEVGQLLTMISMFDNRSLDTEGTQAEAWHLLDFMQRTDYKLAEEAVALFFSQPAPQQGPLPYLDPRWLRTYIGRARQARDVEAARRSARMGITAGPAAPRPPDFHDQVAQAAREAASTPAAAERATAAVAHAAEAARNIAASVQSFGRMP